ncbi:DNA alkylation repair protein [Leucobacter chromiireducens]|uniref:DNA alkylation repair protein n=1 Tax=Leucobacter chromiireducens TaxID=283877 RepID=UPI0019D160ED|nr:DNA alkylation repair protein [Leucobacter chromiireducens]
MTAIEITPASTAAEVSRALAALEDPKARAINERHGDDHGVNLTKLRAIAKQLKRNPALARELWATGGSPERLVALLISGPKDYTADELDAMLRDSRIPKVRDWLVNYIVKKSAHADALRERWFDDPDPLLAGSGWALTTDRVVKRPAGIDRVALLDQIEAEMGAAPESLQWAMNECLAQIGITDVALRARAIDIGERLQVLADYPTPPGCVSPFAPIWITEMVSRQA